MPWGFAPREADSGVRLRPALEEETPCPPTRRTVPEPSPTSIAPPAPAPPPIPLGWRLYVLFTTAAIASLATSVVFLAQHAPEPPRAAAEPVITVNVPPAPTVSPANPPPQPPAITASAVASGAPPKGPARAAAPRIAASPPKPKAVSAGAQETADMLREQLGATVH